ncbi:unnamed protein product [Lactuca saligna]|uniref:Uncharacterized protein n=1 Tax=Lactuca saligna TaxID=75948 RepID=A0AA35Z090_LACSI|nr:unnamed protein product [Lactuca saligna]
MCGKVTIPKTATCLLEEANDGGGGGASDETDFVEEVVYPIMPHHLVLCQLDLNTMLAETVAYVEFFQLQIKLLSSNDLWTYTHLAYNGMDIRLGRPISLMEMLPYM